MTNGPSKFEKAIAETYANMLDQAFNTAIDQAIATVVSLDTFEPSEGHIFTAIISKLEALKKPITQ